MNTIGFGNFYLTFPDRDGWVKVTAPSYDDARVFAVRNYGTSWSWLDREDDFEPWLYRLGEINAFIVEPAGGGYTREAT